MTPPKLPTTRGRDKPIGIDRTLRGIADDTSVTIQDLILGEVGFTGTKQITNFWSLTSSGNLLIRFSINHRQLGDFECPHHHWYWYG